MALRPANTGSIVTEYVYNSSVSTVSDIVSFATGKEGAQIQAFAPTGLNSVEKRVRFATAIKDTDIISIEIKANGIWTEAAESGLPRTFNDAGNTAYGIAVSGVAAAPNDLSVVFQSGPQPGAAWSSYSGAGIRWRVRRIITQ